METKQHATEQLSGKWQNFKIPGEKWKYGMPQSMESSTSSINSLSRYKTIPRNKKTIKQFKLIPKKT